ARCACWTDECVRPYTNLSNYFNAHGTGGAADALDCSLDRGGVQVGHFLLGDEGKRAVAVYRDHDRDNQAFHFLLVGSGVELLAELHDVDLRLTERRAH